ncbi:TetR family transcriptional regulator [Subtercola lobariae]|uniref:TetR family transcriptional regulator n=2 Tax=Subtercola lobariae TaxID=1588641 RepID=A0A917EZR9_9MICO|nr:TetR family transcriptional regulator [Subtercola lobariae]
MAATHELMGEGGAVSMEAIAKRAGVSKETLYRWWPSKTSVVLDALAERGQSTIPLPDTGTLRGDLAAFLRSTADSADPATRHLLRAIAAAAANDLDAAAEIRTRFISARRAALNRVLARAATRGEVIASNADTLLDLIYGSLWYRLIFDVGPLDHTWADDIAAAIAPAP